MSFMSQANDVLNSLGQVVNWVLKHPEETALWMGGVVLVFVVVVVATHASHERKRRREKEAEAARRRQEESDNAQFN